MTEKDSYPQITGIYLGERGANFKSLITGLLKKGKLKQSYIDLLTSSKNMERYGDAFTSELVDMKGSYQMYEQAGDVVGNQFIVWYIYRRFPQLCCAQGVKIVARLRINYGSRASFSGIAEKFGFWPFISATNDLRVRKRKDLLEDVFEAFLGVTGILMDEQVHLGLGYATCYKILAGIFDEFPISLRYEDLYDAKTRLKELFDLHGDKLGPLIYEETKDDETHMTTSSAFRLEGALYDTRADGTVNMNKIRGKYRRVLIGKGSALLKSDAQQGAATEALKNLAEQGYVKHAPAIYAKFATNAKKEPTTMRDVLRICESRDKVNELFFTRGKSKYQSKYQSTALVHFCRERDVQGITLCLSMGANPNIPDTDGQTCLDVLLIGSVDEELVSDVVTHLLKRAQTLDVHQNVVDHYLCRYLGVDLENPDFFTDLVARLVIKPNEEVADVTADDMTHVEE